MILRGPRWPLQDCVLAWLGLMMRISCSIIERCHPVNEKQIFVHDVVCAVLPLGIIAILLPLNAFPHSLRLSKFTVPHCRLLSCPDSPPFLVVSP